MTPLLLLPVVIWDNAPFCRLVCAVESDGIPVAHLSIRHGIQDAEYRSFLEAHLVFRRCLVVKMRSVEAKLKMTVNKIIFFFFIKYLPHLSEYQCTVDFEVQKMTRADWEQSGVITLLLQKLTAIFIYRCESPVHGTDTFTSPPKESILSWNNYPILSIYLTGEVEVRNFAIGRTSQISTWQIFQGLPSCVSTTCVRGKNTKHQGWKMFISQEAGTVFIKHTYT